MRFREFGASLSVGRDFAEQGALENEFFRSANALSLYVEKRLKKEKVESDRYRGVLIVPVDERLLATAENRGDKADLVLYCPIDWGQFVGTAADNATRGRFVVDFFRKALQFVADDDQFPATLLESLLQQFEAEGFAYTWAHQIARDARKTCAGVVECCVSSFDFTMTVRLKRGKDVFLEKVILSENTDPRIFGYALGKVTIEDSRFVLRENPAYGGRFATKDGVLFSVDIG